MEDLYEFASQFVEEYEELLEDKDLQGFSRGKHFAKSIAFGPAYIATQDGNKGIAQNALRGALKRRQACQDNECRRKYDAKIAIYRKQIRGGK